MAKENNAVETNEEDLSVWTWKLSKPVTYNGEEISELNFDFNKITGRDAIEIEDELQRIGKLSMFSQVSNINYIIRVAARGCEKAVGSDIFSLVSISDFNALRNHVQLFLVNIPS